MSRRTSIPNKPAFEPAITTGQWTELNSYLLIFIRLRNPYLQTYLSSASLYQNADSQLEQLVVIWQDLVWVSRWKFVSRHDFRLICCTDSAGHVCLRAQWRRDVSMEILGYSVLWERASGAFAFLTPESEAEADCQHIKGGCKIALKH